MVKSVKSVKVFSGVIAEYSFMIFSIALTGLIPFCGSAACDVLPISFTICPFDAAEKVLSLTIMVFFSYPGMLCSPKYNRGVVA